jgi:hypothetical protein
MDMIGGIELVIMNDFIDLDDLIRVSKTNKYFNNHPYVKHRITRHLNGIKTCFDIVSEHEDVNSWGGWEDRNKGKVYSHEYWCALFYYNYNYNLNTNIRSNVLDPYQLACYYSYFIRNYYYKNDIYFRDSYINVDADGDSCKYGDNSSTTTKIWNKNGDRSWIDRDTINGVTCTYSKWSCIAYPDGYIKALSPRNGDPLVMSPYDSEIKITFIMCYKEESRETKLRESCIQNVEIQYHYNFKTNWTSKIYIHPLFLKHCLKIVNYI